MLTSDFCINKSLKKLVVSEINHIFAPEIVYHENKSTVCRVAVRNFGRDGVRPTAFGEQALIANRFMLL